MLHGQANCDLMSLAQKAQQAKVEGMMLRQDHNIVECLNKDVVRRIALCRNTERANCVGTARYLLGEETDDVFVPTETGYPTYLAGLKRLKEPAVGCYAVWVWQPYKQSDGPIETEKKTGRYPINEVYHMGVVASLNPLSITHRECTHGRFIENQPLAELEKDYDSRYFELLFYRL